VQVHGLMMRLYVQTRVRACTCTLHSRLPIVIAQCASSRVIGDEVGACASGGVVLGGRRPAPRHDVGNNQEGPHAQGTARTRRLNGNLSAPGTVTDPTPGAMNVAEPGRVTDRITSVRMTAMCTHDARLSRGHEPKRLIHVFPPRTIGGRGRAARSVDRRLQHRRGGPLLHAQADGNGALRQAVRVADYRAAVRQAVRSADDHATRTGGQHAGPAAGQHAGPAAGHHSGPAAESHPAGRWR
jgi:hypothetical protein